MTIYVSKLRDLTSMNKNLKLTHIVTKIALCQDVKQEKLLESGNKLLIAAF